jgi:8-oxo-dGTP diphosphatase
MGVLLQNETAGRGRTSATLPWGAAHGDETLDAAALRIARAALGTTPTWMDQIGAFGDGNGHPGSADLSVAFVGVVPPGTEPPNEDDARWAPLGSLPSVSSRHRTIAGAAFDTLRSRLERYPVAFRLLPATFTLSELQHTYELLLSRKLHKASFRRALQTAGLVQATGEWRSEGRGRPAQLFRYAPKKKKGPTRGIRF